MKFHEVLRARRTELGMTQVDVARAIDITERQVKRYEAGQSQPVLAVAVALANTLQISLTQLAGITSEHLDLGGHWWAAWQTFKDQQEIVTLQEVNLHHHRDIIQVHALTRGLDVVDGGYLWSGELKLWDQEVLTGWYTAADGATRSKGTMYFTLHPHGQQMTGRWVGLSYDSDCETGLGAIARNEADANGLIDQLRQTSRTDG